MASYFGRQQSAASMASLPPDEVEFELDLEGGTGGAPGGVDEGAVGGADGITGTPPSRKLLGRRDSTSFDTSRLTSEEVVRLNSGLEHIMDIMGDPVSEHVIKTTIVRCNFDAEKALNELLTSPQHDIHDSPPKKPKVSKTMPTSATTSAASPKTGWPRVSIISTISRLSIFLLK